ncbi:MULTISPECIES: hypothetical protein [Wolbachia]|nr:MULTISPECIES: hypothetical protein [Wolbachia]
MSIKAVNFMLKHNIFDEAVLSDGSQWALLHHSRKEQAVTDGICYKIDI